MRRCRPLLPRGRGQVLEAASKLSAYPEDEFTALLELLSEAGRVRGPWRRPLLPALLRSRRCGLALAWF